MADLRHINEEDATDVSLELGEENPANRLYRLPSGQIIKVKAYEMPASARMNLPAQARVFRITSSMCDATGSVIPGKIGPVHMIITNLSPGGEDHSVQVDKVRRKWAVWTEEFFTRHVEEIAGVVQLPEQ